MIYFDTPIGIKVQSTLFSRADPDLKQKTIKLRLNISDRGEYPYHLRCATSLSLVGGEYTCSPTQPTLKDLKRTYTNFFTKQDVVINSLQIFY